MPWRGPFGHSARLRLQLRPVGCWPPTLLLAKQLFGAIVALSRHVSDKVHAHQTLWPRFIA
eukprot:15076203-Alexandrium_andersonii.AAC.1